MCAPFLELDLRRIRTRLGRDELLEVANGVVGAALHAHCTLAVSSEVEPCQKQRRGERTFAPKAVVRDDLQRAPSCIQIRERGIRDTVVQDPVTNGSLVSHVSKNLK